jgi:hypothetical protein
VTGVYVWERVSRLIFAIGLSFCFFFADVNSKKKMFYHIIALIKVRALKTVDSKNMYFLVEKTFS